MSRWYDRPDGWKDRVQAVVCHVFGCACTAAEGASEADDPNPDRGGGEAQPCAPSAWAGAPPGVVSDAAPESPDEAHQGGVRTRRTARDRRRVGVVTPAAPTTNQRSA